MGLLTNSDGSQPRRDDQKSVCACPVCFANVCLANRDKPNLGRLSDDLEPKTKRLRLYYDAPIITPPIKGTQTKYLCNAEVHTCKPGVCSFIFVGVWGSCINHLTYLFSFSFIGYRRASKMITSS